VIHLDEVTVPGRPDIDGLTFRHIRLPADFTGMAAANQATRDRAGIEEIASPEVMARDYATFPHWDPDADTVIAERDGRIVGYARTDWRDLTDGTRAFQTIVCVEPAQERTGIVEAMLSWAEARLAAIARSIPATDVRPGTMRQYVFGTDAELAKLLQAHGWIRSGRNHEMTRPTLDDVPDVPLPSGLVVRPIAADRAARRALWDAASEAFADERGEAEPSEADWEAFDADPLEDPSLWIVAFEGDEIAGGVLGKIDPAENEHHGRERGIVAAVFTRRPWRRRGLARALIARSLVRLRDHGMTSAYLGVDGLNPNQAMHLYEDLGFEIANTTYDWIRPLPEPDDPPTAHTGTT
jgi:GNAT superfamily N-acetyltransferase